VVQHFWPEAEVVEGEVWTGEDVEAHFWNVLARDGAWLDIDLSWNQFPPGSSVRACAIRDRSTFGDGPQTVCRVETLLSRVTARLDAGSRP
jgi:hypothetical protein